MKPFLYLIPNTLGSEDPREFIGAAVFEKIKGIRHFIVESERNARRFLVKAGLNTPVEQLTFHILDEHSQRADTERLVSLIYSEKQVGLLSDAGLPGIADPGSDLIRLAHSKGIRIIPLSGPSSIFLALMASGLNGQNFAFSGYLPIKKLERIKKIRSLESRARVEKQSQVFMETPYRNMSMLEDLLNSLQPETLLCIAADLTLPGEFIDTLTVREWKMKIPDLKKKPAIFILQAS